MKRVIMLVTILLPLVALVSVLKTFTPVVHAIDVGGPITSDTTWTLANSPYVMTQTVTVQAGITLTIEPGVTVIGDSDAWLEVQGNLIANGTEMSSLLFTSENDSNTNTWGGVVIYGSGEVSFATIRNAQIGLGITGNASTSVILTNSHFEANNLYPISVSTDRLHHLQLENISFSNNVLDRILIDTSSANDTLAGNVSLTSQTGLDGYEISDAVSHLIIPNGITLTLEAGTTLTSANNLRIEENGRLLANGNTTNPVIIGSQGLVIDGSTSFNHTIINQGGSAPGTNWGLGIFGNNQNAVVVDHSFLEGLDYPIIVATDALHRLDMNNVTFINNGTNRVIIDGSGNNEDLTHNVTLNPQPGLEGYEFFADDYFLVQKELR